MKKLFSAALLALGLTPLLPATQASAQEPFIGQVTYFGGNFAPRGWAFCDGQLLAISQNDALFSILGTIYGGDGRTTFGLPDMRGRALVHAGTGPGLSPRRLGSKGGSERVTLTTNQLASHSHTGIMKATSVLGDGTSPGNGSLAESAVEMYLEGASSLSETIAPGSGTLSNTGGSQAHNNMMPWGTANCIIALVGIYPSRN